MRESQMGQMHVKGPSRGRDPPSTAQRNLHHKKNGSQKKTNAQHAAVAQN